MDDTRPIPGHGDTRPLFNPHSGQTEQPTELLEHTDPALLRLHLRRLQEMVDKLVDRETRRAGELAGGADLLWAVEQLEQRIAAAERWGHTRDLGALVVAAGVVAWTGAWTALVAALAWMVTQ